MMGQAGIRFDPLAEKTGYWFVPWFLGSIPMKSQILSGFLSCIDVWVQCQKTDKKQFQNFLNSIPYDGSSFLHDRKATQTIS